MKLLLCLNVLYIVSLLNSSLYLNKNIISSSLDNNKTIIKSRKEIGEDEDYITLLRNNYQKLIDAYNEASKDKLLATELLVCRKMNNEDDLYYLGFDKGFAIVDSNKTVVEVTNRDYTYKDDLNDYDEIFYRGNTFYYKKDDELIELIDDRVYTIKTSSAEGSQSNGVSHNGQIRPGDGTIYDLDDYIDDRYAGFTVTNVFSSCLNNTMNVYQFDTSFYLNNAGGSECNCVLNATYSMLLHMGINGWAPTFYYGDTYIDCLDDISDDPHYHDLVEIGNWSVNYRQRIGTEWHGYNCLEKIPGLYNHIRNRALEYCYDEGSDFQFLRSMDLISYVDGFYNYQITTGFCSDTGVVKNRINDEMSSFIGVSGSETYGNHAMCVVGYETYNFGISGFFNFSLPRIFFRVDDGFSNKIDEGQMWTGPIFFDPYYSDSFIFVVASENIVDLSLC